MATKRFAKRKRRLRGRDAFLRRLEQGGTKKSVPVVRGKGRLKGPDLELSAAKEERRGTGTEFGGPGKQGQKRYRPSLLHRRKWSGKGRPLEEGWGREKFVGRWNSEGDLSSQEIHSWE